MNNRQTNAHIKMFNDEHWILTAVKYLCYHPSKHEIRLRVFTLCVVLNIWSCGLFFETFTSMCRSTSPRLILCNEQLLSLTLYQPSLWLISFLIWKLMTRRQVGCKGHKGAQGGTRGYKGMQGGLVYQLLPLATSQCVIIGNLEFEAYFEVFYSIWVNYSSEL